MNQFLPVTKADLAERGWEEFDFLVITGDAYVDHPSFGPAIISRVLEAEGYRVAILAQPDWRKAGSFTALGRPRLGVLLSSGNIDSMVAHYTVAKKRRHDDAYSPGNRAGLRPDRAVIVYANKVREAFGDIPLVIGGLEASLRRLPTTTIGRTRCAAPSSSTARRICWSTAWESAPPGKLRPVWPPERPSGRLQM